MRRPALGVLLGLALAGACTAERRPQADAASDTTPTVVLETSKGTIVLELRADSAPETVAHFMRHVRAAFYDSVVFHRVEPGFVIQAGALQPDMRRRSSSAFPLPNENPTGILNERGTVAMARTGDPHSAVAEFFINLRDNRALDFQDSTVRGFGYAAFGRVVEGMDVVDAIAATPTAPRGRYRTLPTEPIVIERAYVRGGRP